MLNLWLSSSWLLAGVHFSILVRIVWRDFNSSTWINFDSLWVLLNLLRALTHLVILNRCLIIIILRNSLIVIFNKVLLLDRHWSNFAASTSLSLRNFWFHAFSLFLALFQLSSWLWLFMHIITNESVICDLLSLFLRSVVTLVWLTFNISCSSTSNTLLDIAGPRFISLIWFSPLLDALSELEPSLRDFILVQNINLIWIFILIPIENDVALVVVCLQLVFAFYLFDIGLNIWVGWLFAKQLTFLYVWEVIHESLEF